MEGDAAKLLRKVKEDPIVPIGLMGLIGTCAYGAYKYKTAKNTMSTSVYLMQLRVTAQAAVVGCMMVGMIFNMAKNLREMNSEPHKETKKQ